MTYSQARDRAARLLSSTFAIAPHATQQRRFFEAVAKHGGWGIGARTSWSFGTYSQTRALAEKLIAKGLLVEATSERGIRFQLSDEQQEKFDFYVEHFQAEIDAAEAEEARLEAAAQARRRHVVVAVNRYDGTSQTLGEVYVGADSDVQARNAAYHWMEYRDGDQFETLVVRIADVEQPIPSMA